MSISPREMTARLGDVRRSSRAMPMQSRLPHHWFGKRPRSRGHGADLAGTDARARRAAWQPALPRCRRPQPQPRRSRARRWVAGHRAAVEPGGRKCNSLANNRPTGVSRKRSVSAAAWPTLQALIKAEDNVLIGAAVRAGEAVGLTIANIVTLFAPPRVILVGSSLALGEPFREQHCAMPMQTCDPAIDSRASPNSSSTTRQTISGRKVRQPSWRFTNSTSSPWRRPDRGRRSRCTAPNCNNPFREETDGKSRYRHHRLRQYLVGAYLKAMAALSRSSISAASPISTAVSAGERKPPNSTSPHAKRRRSPRGSIDRNYRQPDRYRRRTWQSACRRLKPASTPIRKSRSESISRKGKKLADAAKARKACGSALPPTPSSAAGIRRRAP